MVQPQPVIGFFDNVAEAQQAVQKLLGSGFSREVLSLSTQTGLDTTSSPANTRPTDAENSTGRFLFSLFGSIEEARPGVARPSVARPGLE
ncbi:MAG: hypothetical protein LH609_00645 [Rudanella sp.]|nr:hypothetical protein [Rudanella sp.]